jgi:hypothetical protein
VVGGEWLVVLVTADHRHGPRTANNHSAPTQPPITNQLKSNIPKTLYPGIWIRGPGSAFKSLKTQINTS